MKELDIVFERFLAHGFAALDDDAITALDRLLDLPDQDIYDWIAGRSEPTETDFEPIIESLRATSAQLPWQHQSQSQ